MEEQKTKSKMSLLLPFVMYLPGRKVGDMRRKMGPEIHPDCSGSSCWQLIQEEMPEEPRITLVWQARREAEVWDMGRRWQ